MQIAELLSYHIASVLLLVGVPRNEKNKQQHSLISY